MEYEIFAEDENTCYVGAVGEILLTETDNLGNWRGVWGAKINYDKYDYPVIKWRNKIISLEVAERAINKLYEESNSSLSDISMWVKVHDIAKKVLKRLGDNYEL